MESACTFCRFTAAKGSPEAPLAEIPDKGTLGPNDCVPSVSPDAVSCPEHFAITSHRERHSHEHGRVTCWSAPNSRPCNHHPTFPPSSGLLLCKEG